MLQHNAKRAIVFLSSDQIALFRLSVTSPRVSRFLRLYWRYRVQISGRRPAIMTRIYPTSLRFSPGKSWVITFSQATAASFFTLSNLLLSNHRNVRHIITWRTKRILHYHHHRHHHHHHHNHHRHVACRVLGLMTFSGPIKSLEGF